MKETNITLISSDDYESIATYISEKVNETRKMYFIALGFKLYKNWISLIYIEIIKYSKINFPLILIVCLKAIHILKIKK